MLFSNHLDLFFLNPGWVGGGLRSGKALGQETFRPVAGCCVHCRLGKTQER